MKGQPQQPLEWMVSESIALEMDMLLNFFSGGFPQHFTSVTFGKSDSLSQQAQELKKTFESFLPHPIHKFTTFLKIAVALGIAHKNDYQKVSLIIRKLTFKEIVDLQVTYLQNFFKLPPPQRSPEQTWVGIRLAEMKFYSKVVVGNNEFINAPIISRSKVEQRASLLSKIARGGDLEYEFWHWQDRVFYEFYSPWRKSLQHEIDHQKENAIQYLGGQKGHGVPQLNWTKSQYPQIFRDYTIQWLQSAGGTLQFVPTPYHLGDFAFALGNHVALSLSSNYFLNKDVQNKLSHLSILTKAISDPTRLSVLYCIRESGLYTTELATYFNVARPTMSEHCKILREAGLIETYQVGRKSFHKLKQSSIRELFKELESFLDLPTIDAPKK